MRQHRQRRALLEGRRCPEQPRRDLGSGEGGRGGEPGQGVGDPGRVHERLGQVDRFPQVVQRARWVVEGTRRLGHARQGQDDAPRVLGRAKDGQGLLVHCQRPLQIAGPVRGVGQI